MTKQLIITSCDECPYLIKESEDAWFRPMCANTNRIFDYDEVNINIPSDCPLDDATDESCIGDLTPDDIEHIVDIARRIKNAKNVREGRYG